MSKKKNSTPPSNTASFSMKRLNANAALGVGQDLALAFAGNLVGNALGGGGNKLGAIALAAVGVATGKSKYTGPVALGMFVSTPTVSTKTAIAEAGGVGNWLKTAPKAMKLQAARHLQNVTSTATATKMLNVSAEELKGLGSLEDYIEGLANYEYSEEADMQGMNYLPEYETVGDIGAIDYAAFGVV